MGAKLTPMQGRIFDLIQRGGDDGIMAGDLCTILGIRRQSLKTHIWDINGELQLCDYRIRGSRNDGCFYRLVKVGNADFYHKHSESAA